MKPTFVSVRVDWPREKVFALLAVLADHVQFSDHMLTDWSFDRPLADAGRRARAPADLPAEQPTDVVVAESVPPGGTAHETGRAGGERRTHGTYTLEVLPDGATRVRFQLEYLEAPGSEHLTAPLIRAHTKRTHANAMRRLGEALVQSKPQVAPTRLQA